MFGNRKGKKARRGLAQELVYHPGVMGVRLVVERGRGEVLEVELKHELRQDEQVILHNFGGLPVVVKVLGRHPRTGPPIEDEENDLPTDD